MFYFFYQSHVCGHTGHPRHMPQLTCCGTNVTARAFAPPLPRFVWCRRIAAVVFSLSLRAHAGARHAALSGAAGCPSLLYPPGRGVVLSFFYVPCLYQHLPCLRLRRPWPSFSFQSRRGRTVMAASPVFSRYTCLVIRTPQSDLISRNVKVQHPVCAQPKAGCSQ